LLEYLRYIQAVSGHQILADWTVWYQFYGFVSIGSLCYYKGDPDGVIPDASDLIQFIPRAVTFLTIAVLYSMLYKFLRRPDTIQISSRYDSRRSSVADGKGAAGLQRLVKRVQGKESVKEDTRPPWEQMEFVQVGHRQWDEIIMEPAPQLTRSDVIDLQPTSSLQLPDPSSRRQSTSSSIEVGAPPWERQRASDAETLVTPTSAFERDGSRLPQALSPVLSERKARFDSVERIESEDEDYGEGKNDQTMAEFFQENAADPGGGDQAGQDGVQPMSAAAYFNRQASLLMLYFPLAVSVSVAASADGSML
jgi:hypothetical protein